VTDAYLNRIATAVLGFDLCNQATFLRRSRLRFLPVNDVLNGGGTVLGAVEEGAGFAEETACTVRRNSGQVTRDPAGFQPT
jgi:hypothetical protein